VTNNHQEKNARILEQRGCAVVLTEGEDMGVKLFDAVSDLLNDRDKRSKMSASLRQMVKLDCADRICDLIEQLSDI
jgi:UDP-N-acetylglucosamine--N-acetylmuramyl-(pentapeptide) pyrophosphoryl-undecaprenol N-acetylglucosamine transferase